MKPLEFYKEQYRPQFHFTAKEHWLNDPNGMLYYNGEYHLFFQHNPDSVDWGNMTWGHALSKDMIHWEQLPHAIYPDQLGTIFSGSALVDWENRSGFQHGNEPPLVAAYTSAGGFAEPKQPFTQSLAYSNDRGRSWQKYEHNPVLPNLSGGEDRDPRLLWHKSTEQWVMVLYIDQPRSFAFFTSTDLKTWTQTGTIPDLYECPDFFELPIDNDLQKTRWILIEGNGHYMLGDFDGQVFTPETEKLPLDHGSNFYATQTFNDMPAHDDRRIQIAWMRGGKYPGMPFNQQMGFPCVLSLRTFPEGPRLCRQPIREIETLRAKEYIFKDRVLRPNENLLDNITGALFEIRIDCEINTAQEIAVEVYGQRVAYNAGTHHLSAFEKQVELIPVENKITLHLLVDRTSLEIFANDGRISISSCFLPKTEETGISLSSSGGEALIHAAEIYELRSVWKHL